MEIYSMKIESDVLHFAQPSEGTQLEGWGIEGVSRMLEEVTKGPYGYDFLNVHNVVEFYKYIEPRMSPSDEVWIDLVDNEVKNIRFRNDGILQSFPDLFILHNS